MLLLILIIKVIQHIEVIHKFNFHHKYAICMCKRLQQEIKIYNKNNKIIMAHIC